MDQMTSMTNEQELRVDLAAAFRIIAKLGMHEAVANHFSAAVSPDGRKFLMNPKWRHFSRIKASDLVLFDADTPDDAKERPDVDPTAWAIHSQMHKLLPQARVVMHLHPPLPTRRSGRSTRTPPATSTGLLSTAVMEEWLTAPRKAPASPGCSATNRG